MKQTVVINELPHTVDALTETVTVQRECLDCHAPLQFEATPELLQFGPRRCDRCSDAHCRRMDVENRERWVASVVDSFGIEEIWRSYDAAKDPSRLFPWIMENAARNLWISGKNQLGKTHCAGYAMHCLLQRDGIDTLFIQTLTWLPRVLRLYNSRAGDAETAMYLATHRKLVVLDDLGKTRVTDYRGDGQRGAELLLEIIDARLRKRLPTWITTNFTGVTLAERLGDDIAAAVRARLRRSYLEFKWPTEAQA